MGNDFWARVNIWKTTKLNLNGHKNNPVQTIIFSEKLHKMTERIKI